MSIRSFDGSDMKLPLDGQISNFRTCKTITFDVPQYACSGILINMISVSPEFEAKSLPCSLRFPSANGVESIDLEATSNRPNAVLPVKGCRAELYIV